MTNPLFGRYSKTGSNTFPCPNINIGPINTSSGGGTGATGETGTTL
jgi:hypothetical protein